MFVDDERILSVAELTKSLKRLTFILISCSEIDALAVCFDVVWVVEASIDQFWMQLLALVDSVAMSYLGNITAQGAIDPHTDRDNH
jgi:hypothetical protein